MKCPSADILDHLLCWFAFFPNYLLVCCGSFSAIDRSRFADSMRPCNFWVSRYPAILKESLIARLNREKLAAMESVLDAQVLFQSRDQSGIARQGFQGKCRSLNLNQGGYTPFLVKVVNQGTVTTRLECDFSAGGSGLRWYDAFIGAPYAT
jgi:hypothetical protein